MPLCCDHDLALQKNSKTRLINVMAVSDLDGFYYLLQVFSLLLRPIDKFGDHSCGVRISTDCKWPALLGFYSVAPENDTQCAYQFVEPIPTPSRAFSDAPSHSDASAHSEALAISHHSKTLERYSKFHVQVYTGCS